MATIAPETVALVRARDRARLRAVGAHPAWLATWTATALFALVYGALAVRSHRNFGTWGFDTGIYDQAFWLVSRGRSFMTMRGMTVWGHHVNLIAFAFAPFYWLGAGPELLVGVQAAVLALGAVPVHLIARDRIHAQQILPGFLPGISLDRGDRACVVGLHRPYQDAELSPCLK